MIMTKEYKDPKEFLANVYTNGKCIKRKVECLISFSNNQSLYPKIAIIFKDNLTLNKIAANFNIDIKARRYDINGKLISEIKTINGYYINPDERFYDYLLNKNCIEIGYTELIDHHYLPDRVNLVNKNIIIFYIVNINFSFSFGGSTHDEKGIHHKMTSHFGKMKIIDRAVMSFTTEIHYTEVGDDIYRKHSKQILSIEYDSRKSNPKRIESFITSFIPYLSFLSQSNVGYNRVELLNKEGNVLTNTYHNLGINPKNQNYSSNADDAIDRSHHKQFIKEVVSKLSSGINPDIKSIYQYNNANSNLINQSSYIITFMALEALLDAYVNANKRQFINYLVKKHPNKLRISKKDYFKKTIKYQSEKLINKYKFIMSISGINNNDLWPLCDDQKGYLNLSRIRNKIVHQGKIKDQENLWCAFCHLQWIYLRLFLYIVKWSGPHELTPHALSTYIPYFDWKNRLISE